VAAINCSSAVRKSQRHLISLHGVLQILATWKADIFLEKVFNYGLTNVLDTNAHCRFSNAKYITNRFVFGGGSKPTQGNSYLFYYINSLSYSFLIWRQAYFKVTAMESNFSFLILKFCNHCS